MGLLHPELLLLLLPAGVVWWKTRNRGRTTMVLRALALLLVVSALALPYLSARADGRDLIVVVDRSRSMPTAASAAAVEVIGLAEDARVKGDRVGVVSFGARAAIERLPLAEGSFDLFERPIEPDGSDLGEALEAALNLIPEGRRGSILVLSDGEENGRDPLDAARRAFARGVHVDVRPYPRPARADLSVERVDLPREVAVGEPFQFTVWVHSDRRVTSGFRLRRQGRVISEGQRVFEPGMNRVLFRDILTEGGIADYVVDLDHEGDRVPENNRGLGALTAVGTRPLLVLNDDGGIDTLVAALRASKVEVDVARPEALRLDAISLSRWRGVILENVAAPRLGTAGLEALHEFVTERGGGLLMTGGKASYGVGGYHLTPVDEILPVSMELRQEHRKQGVAMAFVLDRSGSMAAPAGAGQTKMDLANLGTMAAIELLSSIDSAGVIAVDSEAHLIQELAPVVDVGGLRSRVLAIESMGGGIYVKTGMVAAAAMLDDASQVNRHIVLFADAADSEEQEGVVELVEQLGEMGTSVSVIALGTESDSDANFLRAVAEAGGGAIYFSTDPAELPKMFSQDTMTVARSTFIEEQTPVRLLPDLFSLGEITSDTFPDVVGYNLNYLREGAIAGAATADEYQAPIFAFHYAGLGRTAAFCAQVGGSHGQEVVQWPAFSAFFVTLARWLGGQEEPTALFPTVRREGTQAVVTVEIDPDAPTPPDTSNLIARLRAPDGEWTDYVLERVDEHRYEARVPLLQAGIVLGMVHLDDERFVTLPPLSLPYSPEYERAADPAAGERLLARLARDTGGEVNPEAHALFRGERAATAHRVISRELALVALLLVLLEIAGRRLALWGAVRVPRSFAELGHRLRRAFTGRRRAAAPTAPRPASVDSAPAAPRGERPAPAPPPKKRRAPSGDSLTSALDAARKKAGRRMDR